MNQATANSVVQTARERILDAALALFGSRSYEATSLRDVALAARVDVAYVHRSFGSKEHLFKQAIQLAIDHQRQSAPGGGHSAESLAREALGRRARARPEEFAVRDLILRSLLSPDAAQVVRAVLEETVVQELSCDLEHPARHRAALIMAFLAGVRIFRDILEIDGLNDDSPQLEALTRRVFEAIIETPSSAIHTPKRTRKTVT